MEHRQVKNIPVNNHWSLLHSILVVSGTYNYPDVFNNGDYCPWSDDLMVGLRQKRVSQVQTFENLCGYAASPSLLSTFPFPLHFIIPNSPPTTAKGSRRALKLLQWVWWSPAAKWRLVHFGLKSASDESSFSAVHEIRAGVHKTRTFRWRKLQNVGRFLWVLSIHNFLHGYSRPEAPT